MPARWAFDPISKRGGGKGAALVDEVLVARYPVMDIVEPGGERLADAVPVEAVPAPARHARHERALDLFLQVQHDGVVFVPQCAPESAKLAP